MTVLLFYISFFFKRKWILKVILKHVGLFCLCNCINIIEWAAVERKQNKIIKSRYALYFDFIIHCTWRINLKLSFFSLIQKVFFVWSYIFAKIKLVQKLPLYKITSTICQWKSGQIGLFILRINLNQQAKKW